MTTKRFALGQVFRYSYKWAHAPNLDEPKERPACLVLKIGGPGGVKLAIVAISDQPSREEGLSIEIPQVEIARAGLSSHRSAYIQLSEVNLDRLENSHTFNPRAKILDSFSKSFVSLIGKKLAANIRSKRAVTILRS